jgi:hypothetical protein
MMILLLMVYCTNMVMWVNDMPGYPFEFIFEQNRSRADEALRLIHSNNAKGKNTETQGEELDWLCSGSWSGADQQSHPDLCLVPKPRVSSEGGCP